MRTAALVAIDGGVDFMCWPDFDSPSVFARMLDKDKGGHFTITPVQNDNLTTKQQYLPSSNILQTRYMHEDGVLNVMDFFPRPARLDSLQVSLHRANGDTRSIEDPNGALKKWLVRRVQCIRGEVELDVEVFPAFNYARDEHTTEISHCIGSIETESDQSVVFKSKDLSLQLLATVDCGEDHGDACPRLSFNKKKMPSTLGEGVTARVKLIEGQAISFILRDYDDSHEKEHVTSGMIDKVQQDTATFWFNWISKSKYKGRWREVVSRSLMLLKMVGIYQANFYTT